MNKTLNIDSLFMIHNANHISVLLNDVLKALDPQPGEFFIDGTLGAGGHAKAVLEKIKSRGTLLGLDWDQRNLEDFRRENPEMKGKLILIHENYANLPEILEKHRLAKADGLLLDLGFSSDQLEHSGRGFSFLKNEPLDMRYNPGDEDRPTAASIVNGRNEAELADIIYRYGEERLSRRIAKKIVERRRERRIGTTDELAEIIRSAVPKNYERGRIHPATRTFQALRIFVNDELGNLESILKNLPEIIGKDGRIAIISFHSLEDRMVKQCFQNLVKEKKARFIIKKPTTAGREESKTNSKSRSAKLRAIAII
ncbi:MAG: 16S rRNA (cytosine(1402)-N(4))-methyltransferase RsmH [Patescibacteria group bacterium]